MESTSYFTMPILMICLFSLVAGGVWIALCCVKKQKLAALIGAIIIAVSAYCIWQAWRTVRDVKKSEYVAR